MAKLLFIFNPKSGKGQMRNNLMDILDIFTSSGYDVTVRPTQARLDAYEYIRTHGKDFDKIVVSGGDGTLNEAVKGIISLDSSERPPLGYIPSGTTNDFASTLSLPKSMTEAARVAAQGDLFNCDTGKFNDLTFNYVAAFGAFTDISYDTPQEIKNALGHTAYVLEAVKRLSSLSSVHVKITHDGGEIDDDIFLCMILNATSVAGIHGSKTLSNVDLCDGMFEMLVLRRPTNLLEFQAILLGLMRGETDGDGYSLVKSSRFEFEAAEHIKWTLDGEYGGDPKHVVVEVLPSAVTYVVDSRNSPSAQLTN